MTGQAVYGLDARPKGALVAAVARCPVPGGRVRSFDAARASRVPGVRRVVAISTGVAVVADDTWAALRGRDALVLRWDEAREPLRLDRGVLGDAPGGVARRPRHAVRGRRDEGALRVRAPAGRDLRLRVPGARPRRADELLRRRAARALHDPRRHTGAEPGPGGGREASRASARVRPRRGAAARRRLRAPARPRLRAGGGRALPRDRPAPVQIVWTRQDEFENDRFQPASFNDSPPASTPAAASSRGPTRTRAST